VCVCVRASVLLACVHVSVPKRARRAAGARRLRSPRASCRATSAVATPARTHQCECVPQRGRSADAARTQRGRSADAAHCLLVKQRRPALPRPRSASADPLDAFRTSGACDDIPPPSTPFGLRGSRSVRWRLEGAGLQHLHEDERVRPRGSRLGRRERSATAVHTRRIGSAAR
jgi:hypothetical protein